MKAYISPKMETCIILDVITVSVNASGEGFSIDFENAWDKPQID